MNVPVCPTHGTPMRAGNKGGFFCPKKMPDGSYCTQRSRGEGSPAPTTVPQAFAATSSHSPQPQQTTPRHLLVIASLDFASRVFQGTGDMSQALDLAKTTLSLFDPELL